jgi:hypothetical protein
VFHRLKIHIYSFVDFDTEEGTFRSTYGASLSHLPKTEIFRGFPDQQENPEMTDERAVPANCRRLAHAELTVAEPVGDESVSRGNLEALKAR